MPIHQDQIATLRALLTGETDEVRHLLGQLDRAAANDGLVSLITAAFFEAAQQRFITEGKPADDAEVIDYIAALRERSVGLAEDVDPDVAETQIKIAIETLPPDTPKTWNKNQGFSNQVILLAALVADENFSEEELDGFMDRVIDLAEEIS